MGSHEILIILECRDRKRVEDITWIEQLAAKRDAIGAHKAIAVSSSGFTSGAIKKARSQNIELRTIEKITLEDISSWFRVHSIRYQNLAISNARANLITKQPHKDRKLMDNFLASVKGRNISDEKIFIDDNPQNPFSLNELLLRKYQKLENGKPILKVKKRKNEGILFPKNRKAGFRLIYGDKRIPIDRIYYNADMEVIEKEVGVLSVKSYKTSENTLAEVVRFDSLDSSESGPSFELTSIPVGELRKFGLRLVRNTIIGDDYKQ